MTRHSRARRSRDRTPIERMSSLDAVFLAVEDRCNPMNIGSVGIFEGPAPSIDEVQKFVASRISRVPRCRQRVRFPKGIFGRPMWIADPHFDIRRHVFHLSLSDTRARTIEDVVAELMASRLDRGHPLWQMWLIDGMAQNEWAVVVKVHHCLMDGIAGNDLLCAILTEPVDDDISSFDQARCDDEPTNSSIVRFNTSALLTTLAARVRGSIRVVAHPARSMARGRSTLRAAKTLWLGQQHHDTSLIGPIGSRRVWARTGVSLKALQSTASLRDCTVNDIVLAAISLGLHHLLSDRGESVDGREVTALIPVSLRRSSERGQIGNRLANVHARLPVGNGDPWTTLSAVHEHLSSLKVSGQVDATGLVMRIGDYIPRFAADRVARAIFHRQRNVHCVVTNVPGPTNPLHFGSRRMTAGYPIAPIGGLVRMTIAAWSYCDTLYLGFTADDESTHDLDRFVRHVSNAFDQILAASD